MKILVMEEPFNIVDLFFNSVRKHPDKIAIIEHNKKISFSELEKQVKSTSAYFISKGIAKGDRVLIFVPMGIELYRMVLAIFNIGAIAVFLDEWVNKKRMEECCKVAKCKAFIGIFKAWLFSWFSSELRKIPIKLRVHNPSIGQTGEIHIKVSKSDTALITFTTGSTGTPKAAKRTHGFLNEQFNALIEKIDPKEEDIDMPVLPIVLLVNLGVGCTSVIAEFKANKPESMNPRKILAQINNHKVTRLISSPFFVKQLAKHILKHKLTFPAVKKIFTGGAPVFPSEAEVYREAFPGAQTEVVYGSTEAEPISSININEFVNEKENILQNGLRVGVPYRKAEVKIIEIIHEPILCANEEELKKHILLYGKIGEIIVSGPHVLREYFNNEDALKRNKIFVGGKCWHRTGDSGYLDENGSLFLTGRCNSLIYSENKVLAPFIYESYFQSLQGVEMGTILQINKRILAVFELKDPHRKKQILEQVNASDIKFDEVKFILKIPRDPRHHSKIDYEKLKNIIL